MTTTAKSEIVVDALSEFGPEVIKTEATIDLSKYAHLNTSGKIRAMAADGYQRNAIAKALGKRYQHVRNVLLTPLKRAQ